ncbi:MAG TPA: hypothetical protein DCZ43_00225 [candidate division Zixibacteria bacterium]|jgi:hypothetical protein|nr:hypothetical protein [candidate division Zixibacteria bacterium]
MVTEKKQVLITVKAYPNPSREYGETVCCAGIDLNNNQLIRLYPIPFRYLDDKLQFKKYSIIEVDCFRSNDDKRPESFKVNCDTIKIIDYLDTVKEGWKRRNDIVLKAPLKSLCQALRDAENDNMSLGIIKPENITFAHTKRWLPDPKIREAHYAQLNLLRKQIDAIEAVPFQFYYGFNCVGINDCPSHELPIVDWEINQAYRSWRLKYRNEKELIEKIKQRWLSIADSNKNNLYLFVGNRKLNRRTFMVLGTFYPPRR